MHSTHNASLLSVVVGFFVVYLGVSDIYLFVWLCVLGTGSILCAAQAGLEVAIFLPQLPKCLDGRRHHHPGLFLISL